MFSFITLRLFYFKFKLIEHKQDAVYESKIYAFVTSYIKVANGWRTG